MHASTCSHPLWTLFLVVVTLGTPSITRADDAGSVPPPRVAAQSTLTLDEPTVDLNQLPSLVPATNAPSSALDSSVPSTAPAIQMVPSAPPTPPAATATPTVLPTIDLPRGNADETPAPDPIIDEALEDETEISYDVPIVLNETVEDYMEYFQVRIRERFAMWLNRSGRYIPLMRDIFREYGLPEDLVFVALIESGFNPYAYSRARAVGAWQFIKSTGKVYGLRIDDWVDERRDPIKSTHAAARYLKDLYARFGSWPLALASYNAGENKIERAITKTKSDDFWDIRATKHIRRETKGYVPKFMAATIIAKNPERYGFTLQSLEPMAFDEAWVAGATSMRTVAEAIDVPYETIKELNPELKAEIAPPDVARYRVKLPAGGRDAFTAAFEAIPAEKKRLGNWHTVRRGDSVASVAKRYGVSASMLLQVNGLQNPDLADNQVLFIPKLRPAKPAPAPRTRVAKAADADANGKTKLYRVQPGDTLWDIAKNFSISLTDLKRLNGITRKHHVIRPGDQLVLSLSGF